MILVGKQCVSRIVWVVTFDTFCFVQTALFLALGAVFQSHSVASLLTADEKSLYFGMEEGKYFISNIYIHSELRSIAVITFYML